MDVRIKAFQEATDTFAYLARLDLAELKQKLGDERLVDGMQNGRAQNRVHHRIVLEGDQDLP